MFDGIVHNNTMVSVMLDIPFVGENGATGTNLWIPIDSIAEWDIIN